MHVKEPRTLIVKEKGLASASFYPLILHALQIPYINNIIISNSLYNMILYARYNNIHSLPFIVMVTEHVSMLPYKSAAVYITTFGPNANTLLLATDVVIVTFSAELSIDIGNGKTTVALAWSVSVGSV